MHWYMYQPTCTNYPYCSITRLQSGIYTTTRLNQKAVHIPLYGRTLYLDDDTQITALEQNTFISGTYTTFDLGTKWYIYSIRKWYVCTILNIINKSAYLLVDI